MDNIKTLKYRGIYSVEYGYISAHILNPKNRIPNADGTLTYKYIFFDKVLPVGGRIVNYDKFRVLEIDISPETYANLVELDRIEYNNNHKHDRRRKELVAPTETDEPFDDSNEPALHKAFNDKWKAESYAVEDKTITELDERFAEEKMIKAGTLSDIGLEIYRLFLMNCTQSRIAKYLGISQGTVSNHIKKIKQLLDYQKNDEDNLSFEEYRVKKLKIDYCSNKNTDDLKAVERFLSKLTPFEQWILDEYAQNIIIDYLAELLFLHPDTRKPDIKNFLAIANDDQKKRLKTKFKGESERAAYARFYLQTKETRQKLNAKRRKRKKLKK